MNAVIVGCSRRKVDTQIPLAALDVYEGGCVPLIRARVKNRSDLRLRVFILSAQHGLLGSDDAIAPYDRALTLERAQELRPVVGWSVKERILEPLAPDKILLVIEPLYFVLLADMLAADTRPVLYWIPDPSACWHQASAILDEWGWPK